MHFAAAGEHPDQRDPEHENDDERDLDRRDLYRQTVDANAESVRIANDQYAKGISGFLTVLDAERSLFASQDDWAYRAQQTTQDYQNLIFKYAALAGMDRTDYNAALSNQKLADFITNEESYASQFWHVDSTPSFVINGTLYHGNIGEDYNSFAATVASEAAKK